MATEPLMRMVAARLHRAVDDFLLTTRAVSTLWPQLPPAQGLEMAERLVMEFM